MRVEISEGKIGNIYVYLKENKVIKKVFVFSSWERAYKHAKAILATAVI